MADALFEPYTNNGKWTYADYKAWELKPRERYEIIHGEAYAMSAPNTFHQSITTEMVRQFANFLLGKKCRVYPAPFDVRLFFKEDESDDTVVQPDITVICEKKKRGKEGCRGAPEFVAEILSPSNTAFDFARSVMSEQARPRPSLRSSMKMKFDVYHEAGVKEYWVLNSENKTLTVHLFKGKKVTTSTHGENDTVPVAVLEGLLIEMKTVFAD